MNPQTVDYDEVAHIRPKQARVRHGKNQLAPFVDYAGGELAVFSDTQHVHVYWRGSRPPSWDDVCALLVAKEEGAQAPLS